MASRAECLLRRAAEIYDRPGSPLPSLAREASRGGFHSGGEWMAAALADIRGSAFRTGAGRVAFNRLGIAKYALCSVGALACAAVATAAGAPAIAGLAVFVLIFYAIEAQGVFLFPTAIDGSTNPAADSRALMRRSGGTVSAIITILPLAATMIFGGVFGRGFIRSWCLGCLAVVLWYEDTREAVMPAHRGGLELFARGPLTTRIEEVRCDSVRQTCKLLYLSDLHLGSPNTPKIAAEILDAAGACAPHAILLGGDLVERRSALPELCALLTSLCRIAPTGAVLGNHDRAVGSGSVSDVVRESGARLLLDDPLLLKEQGIAVIGYRGQPVPKAMTSVLCAHDPEEQCLASRVTLAGHLHGSQCVLWQRGAALYPGKIFFRWNVLRYERKDSTLIVSRGITDTLPIRYNCPREAILCRIG